MSSSRSRRQFLHALPRVAALAFADGCTWRPRAGGQRAAMLPSVFVAASRQIE